MPKKSILGKDAEPKQVTFKAPTGLPSGDWVYDKCMNLTKGATYICTILKEVYCKLLPQACGETPTCANENESCLTKQCCENLYCDSFDNFCKRPTF